MSASTLHSFLIALGFEVSGLTSGGAVGRRELQSLGKAAQDLATTAAPASAAINTIGNAAAQTAGKLNPLITNLNATKAATGPLVTAEQAAADAMKAAAAAAGPLVSAEQALVTANREASASAGGVASAERMKADAMRASTAAAGPLITSQAQFVSSAGAVAGAAGRYGIVMRGVRDEASMAAVGIGQAGISAATAGAGFQAAGTGLGYAGRGAYQAVGGFQAAGAGAGAAAARAFAAGAGFQAAGAGAAGAGAAAGGAAGGFAAAGAAAGGAGAGAAAAAGGMAGVPGPALRAAMALNTVSTAATHVAERSMFMSRVLSMAFAFSGGVAVTTLLGFLGNAVLGFNSRLEQAKIAFTTLLESGPAADVFIAKMERFANLTPFNFQGVVEASQRLMAMGFAADQVLPVLTAVGDATAALGGNTEKLDRITIALGQMSTAGRVNAQDMRQLTEAGIPAWKMLADGIGKTVAETRKMAENGLIPANQALTILMNTMEEKYGGMMAKQARTAQGAFSTIRDVALQTISGAVQPLFMALSQGMVSLADFLMGGGGRFIAPMIQAIGIALTAFLIPALYHAASAAAAVTVSLFGITVPIMPLIIALTTLGIAWQENFGGIRTTLEPLVGEIGNLAGSVLNLASSTGLLMPIIVALSVAITTKFLVGLVASTIAMIANIATTRALVASLSTLTPVAAGAGVSMWNLAAGSRAASLSVAALALPLTLLAIAAALLILNFDRVAQGTRVVHIAILGLQKAFFDLQATLSMGPQADYFRGLSQMMQNSIDAVKADMASAEADINRKQKEIDDAAKGSDPMGAFQLKLGEGVNGVVNETQKLVDTFGTTIDGVRRAAANAGGAAMLEMAKSIQATAGAPMDAFKSALSIQSTALSPEGEIARDVGILMSSELANGLKSQIPEVQAAWAAVYKTAIENLDRNTAGAFSAGAIAGRSWSQGLREELAATTKLSPTEIGFEIKQMDVSQTKEAAAAYAELAATWQSKFAPSADQARAAFAAMQDAIKSGSTSAAEGTAALVEKYGNSVEAIKEIAKDAGAATMAELAQGIAQNADAPLNAMKDLLNMQQTIGTAAQEESRLIGILISKQLSDGMTSGQPRVVAQAIATAKFIMDQLNRLQPGAYAVGYETIMALASGMLSPAAFASLNKIAAIGRFMAGFFNMAKTGDFSGYSKILADLHAAMTLVVPDFTAAKAAATDWFAGLNTGAKSASTALADAKDKMKAAFAEIKQAARSYFNELHSDNLKAIEDIRRLADEQADYAATAFRSQITAERAVRREAELRQAVANAKNPADQYKAQQDLVDFLQDQELTKLEEAADAQKKINAQKEAEAKAAENKRYTEQVAAFNLELATLQKYMLRHPEEWKRTQAAVLSLLGKYGLNYITAGSVLSQSFATGLLKSMDKVKEAAAALGAAAAKSFNSTLKKDAPLSGGGTPGAVPTPPPVPKTGSKAKALQSGAWRILEDNLLASLHKDEMVVPSDLAGLLRVLGQGRISTGNRPTFGSSSGSGSTGTTPSFGASQALSSERQSSGGKGTIILMLPNGHELGRISDERIAIEQGLTTVLRPGEK